MRGTICHPLANIGLTDLPLGKVFPGSHNLASDSCVDIELLWYRIGVMEKITANMRRLTITTQESGARLREPGKTLGVVAKPEIGT